MIRFFADADYETYQGAERFRSGQPPMIAETDDRVVIAGKDGVTVILDDLVEWHLSAPRWNESRVAFTVDVAEEIVEMVVDASTTALTILGFKRV